MALNRIALSMLESKVLVRVEKTTNGSLLLTYSDATTFTYVPGSVDLSGLLTKELADQLYEPKGSQSGGGVSVSGSSHGYVEYLPGSYTFVAQSAGIFVTASAGGGGGAMDGLIGLAGTEVTSGGRGQHCTRAFIPTTVGQSYSVTVGQPGLNNKAPLNGNGQGTAGGLTSFDSLLTLQGGGGGYAPYYGLGTDGAGFGSTTMLHIDYSDWSAGGRPFGSGGFYVLNGFDAPTDGNPGRGFMTIEW